ncbi:diguanylate cyclase domain-containing protein [Mesorhizobium australicum]|uniref:PAS domain S-box-containing protein/diguanylate cyclase (GGDEF) domain-containing protein n=1 Tax=Mesorhizobium australicum TaxID=536018 RepID=A0A1X7PN77_9HYPH|nr:diguanylate cyclase [Mesorhizobium australicum]SMH53074.1 PAS domain S-box-containing protein/diguanylate cyclase (GGDEF) domain-containing protein [Mesorhizobium australicum]
MRRLNRLSIFRKNGGRRSLQFHLFTIMLFAVVPVVAATALAVWQAGEAFHTSSESRLRDTSQTLANAVEADLAGTFTSLSTLANLYASGRNTARSFEPWLDEAGTHLGGTLHVVARGLTDIGANNAAFATGLRAIEHRSRAISNLIDPASGKDARIALAVPFETAGGQLQALVFVAKPDRLVHLLQGNELEGSEFLVAVTDGTGHLVGRSRDADRFIGKPVPDWGKLQSMGSPSGLFEAVSKEGSEIMLSFRKLAGTPGWVVVVGENLDAFNARWQGPLATLALSALIAFSIALLGALWMAQRILAPVKALAAYGRGIAEGGQLSDGAHLQRSSIAEFESLRESFIAAQTELRERAEREKEIADTLTLSERRYRAVAEAGALVFWQRDRTGPVTQVTGWRELTGRSDTDAIGLGWMASVHAEDLPVVESAWAECVAKGSDVDVEARVLTPAGWKWVRARGAPIRDAAGEIVEWVGSLEDIDARRSAQARIAHMAHHDTLTGLGNRALMAKRMAEAIEAAHDGQCAALLCIDLDRFKLVNDTMGHPVGDALLCAVAARLKQCVAETDVVIRTGGDEFAVIQSASSWATASLLAAKIVKSLSDPFTLRRQSVSIGASIGVTFIDDPGIGDSELMRRADIALYAAKAEGRGQFHLFDPRMDLQRRRAPARSKPAVREKARSR